MPYIHVRGSRPAPARALVLAAAALLFCPVLVSDARAYPRPGTNDVASAPRSGAANGDVLGERPAISADGRFVAFASVASNLVPGDRNGLSDIFVKDRVTGAVERVSVSSFGSEANDPLIVPGRGQSLSFQPSISANGRYVAFTSYAWNLIEQRPGVPADTNLSCDVYVHDRRTRETERASVTSTGAQSGVRHNLGDVVSGHLESCNSLAPTISDDGQRISFLSLADDLVPGDTNGAPDVFVRDRRARSTVRVSVSSSGAQGVGGSVSSAAISGNGRYVVFGSHHDGLVADHPAGRLDVFRHDLVTRQTELVNRRADGRPGNNGATSPTVSRDGRVVAFDSVATDLVPTMDVVGGLNPVRVYVRDLATRRTEHVSVSSAGELPAQPEGATFPGRIEGKAPLISADGRYVTFYGCGANLTPESADGVGSMGLGRACSYGTYVHDRVTGETELVSRWYDDRKSWVHPGATQVISSDGRSVAYVIKGDISGVKTDGKRHIVVRERGATLDALATRVTTTQGKKHLAGAVTTSGVLLAGRSDAATDARGPLAQALGAELIGASLHYRPEQEDVFVQWSLATLPATHGDTGAPGLGTPPVMTRYAPSVGGDVRVRYVLRFVVDGRAYEIRARVMPAAAVPPLRAVFELAHCVETALDCDITPLRGGLGTTGTEVVVSLPLKHLPGLREGATLRSARLVTELVDPTAVGSGPAYSAVDEVVLPGALTVPRRSVSVSLRAPSAPKRGTVTARPVLDRRGAWRVDLPRWPDARGRFRVTVTVCVTRCVSRTTEVRA